MSSWYTVTQAKVGLALPFVRSFSTWKSLTTSKAALNCSDTSDSLAQKVSHSLASWDICITSRHSSSARCCHLNSNVWKAFNSWKCQTSQVEVLYLYLTFISVKNQSKPSFTLTPVQSFMTVSLKKVLSLNWLTRKKRVSSFKAT